MGNIGRSYKQLEHMDSVQTTYFTTRQFSNTQIV